MRVEGRHDERAGTHAGIAGTGLKGEGRVATKLNEREGEGGQLDHGTTG
jgi:hypothetical protein